ncbi:indolepyruvate ferredoxin oxidoreductase family protein [Cupriavidus sp. WKF15]|uniref:indolepyruvate ferredoxin oxidoreductase family protein n=1 Tax=Cupriavidus sp. WKF15 TaxID=3032282 RepID=UPI0023E225B8|nr:indolepyruvate ferredoxin oxidoreductase family protein [Cupriavidus sp. WKF15]WER50804.1 indolepyruvate ferredoxin oxidoreductase family protein [Cupriavidus sp. WKF15]
MTTKSFQSAATSKDASLNDKYVCDQGTAYMTGIQALVRLTLAQKRRDALIGLQTAGFVSGYRGSPLGNFDSALWQAGELLDAHKVVFQPGVNEDLAATAVWGTQQANLAGQGKYDGVVGWWYGKGPGVDRSGDVLRHANLAGTAERGGVVALYGDDHSCKSSSIPHQSEHVMVGCGIPIFYPTSVQQILDYGAHAVAMSRCAGVWTSMKLVSEIVETSASVSVELGRAQSIPPQDLSSIPGGLNIRWPDRSLAQEERLYLHKLPAALGYARANPFNRVTWDSQQARIGIAASGKGYLDTVEALRILGLEGEPARRLGLRLYQVGMIWPLEPHGLRHFSHGLQEIIVVEEKRPILEAQIKDELYALPDHARPRVIGKSSDGHGEWSTTTDDAPLISHYELQPEPIAKMLAARFLRMELPADLRQLIGQRLQALQHAEQESRRVIDIAERKAYFCSGCPHNSSTVLPEGSRALGGIGCHFLTLTMDRGTETFSQMGGEGVSWVGASPFTKERHVFANLGDGTYFHSGYLAIRQSVAANVNITYKILYNDAVGMTGGQHVDGQLSVAQMTRQLAAEGVRQQIIVTDEPRLLSDDAGIAPGVTIRHRNELDAVQRELRNVSGVTALIYAQTCASEKRRRRKRNEYPDPPQRAFINTEICEGCGDCSKKSNCLSVEPVETPLGTKRKINQSSCNKDFSCVEGFCPSFVTVHTRDSRRPTQSQALATGWPKAPKNIDFGSPVRIIVGGVGGTGVVTIGALLGMAAHLEGKAVRVMDMAGMAQKGGTVYSYVQIARSDDAIAATKVATGQCDLLIGADAVVAGSSATLSRLRAEGLAIVNEDGSPTSDFIGSRDWSIPVNDLLARLRSRLKNGRVIALPAARIATMVFGDAIFANLLLLGLAWQSGRIPLSREGIQRAIALNGTAVAKNLEAFRIGCHLADDLRHVDNLLPSPQGSESLNTLRELIDDRSRRLRVYWNVAYARKYHTLATAVESNFPEDLATVIATQLYRVMAYKDEYEVARLLASDHFKKSIESEFGKGARLTYHLAPPTLGTGPDVHKRPFGSWIRWPMAALARMQVLRETPFDPFGRNDERRKERAWRDRYIAFVESLIRSAGDCDLSLANQIARIPADVRGFGHVKMLAMQAASARWDELAAKLYKAKIQRG